MNRAYRSQCLVESKLAEGLAECGLGRLFPAHGRVKGLMSVRRLEILYAGGST